MNLQDLLVQNLINRRNYYIQKFQEMPKYSICLIEQCEISIQYLIF